MKFSNPQKSTNLENTYEEFLVEMDNEYNHIQVYFADLYNFSNEKKNEIKNEFLNENKEVVLSLSKQPNYSLYTNKFNDLLAKSIIITLLSNFEFNFVKLIELLEKEGYIKHAKFKKPKNRIIYYCFNFLYDNSTIKRKDIGYETFEIFIKLRNSIVHQNSEISEDILNHPNYKLYNDFIIIKDGQFFFNNILINHHLTKILRTFFNSLAYYIK